MTRCLRLALIPAAVLGLGSQPLAAQVCLPTCSPVDARLLLVGAGAFGHEELELVVAAPPGAASFTLGIFDGDIGLDYGGVIDPAHGNWDTAQVQGTYTLVADPLADGSGSAVVASWDSLVFPNNSWVDFTVPTGAEAETPSGAFYYRLRVTFNSPVPADRVQGFKVRTSAALMVPAGEPFVFSGYLAAINDVWVVYPDYPSLSPTTYDGTFSWSFPSLGATDLAVWDGDFDRGTSSVLDPDTDDPDTQGVPAWASPLAVPERAGGAGNPPDDRAVPMYRRTPSVRYDLTFPDGLSLPDDDVSGSEEWEQFRISTDPSDPLLMDVLVSSIPPGVYGVQVQGLDLSNAAVLRLPAAVLSVDASGVPQLPPPPFLVGDTVFLDLDGDGLRGSGEPGLPGVLLEVLGPTGAVLHSTTTDTAGAYAVGVGAGSYTVAVSPSNFAPGGALQGMASTTGGETRSGTVVTQNILTLDFGYELLADLSVIKDDGIPVAHPGDPVAYTIVVANAGPGNAPGSTVSDVFPAGLTSVVWTCTPGSGSSCTPGPVSGHLSDVADVAAGGTVTYTAVATVAPGFVGTLSNTATVAAGAGVSDLVPANDSDTDTTLVSSPARVEGSKEVSGDFRERGTVLYTIVLRNPGPHSQQDNPGHEFLDVLPPQLTLEGAEADAGIVGVVLIANTVTWNGSLRPGGRVDLTIEARIRSGTRDQTILNQGEIHFDGDGNGDNESSAVTDDPTLPGSADRTSFRVATLAAIPTLGTAGAALFAFLLLLVATLRRPLGRAGLET